jgi:hypothetical protein
MLGASVFWRKREIIRKHFKIIRMKYVELIDDILKSDCRLKDGAMGSCLRKFLVD